jgi:hypothetical protein
VQREREGVLRLTQQGQNALKELVEILHGAEPIQQTAPVLNRHHFVVLHQQNMQALVAQVVGVFRKGFLEVIRQSDEELAPLDTLPQAILSSVRTSCLSFFFFFERTLVEKLFFHMSRPRRSPTAVSMIISSKTRLPSSLANDGRLSGLGFQH